MIDTFWIALADDDNGTRLVTCRALPEVTTFGEDAASAWEHGKAAIEEALAARMSRWGAIPDGGAEEPGELPVHMAAATAMKLYLYDEMQRQGMTRAALARRLGWNRNSVDRLFQIDHASRLEQLEAAATALGARLAAQLVKADAA